MSESIFSVRKRIFHTTGEAIQDFSMICEGDKIMVGLSGGKDSWVLLLTLEELRIKAPVSFTICGVKVDYPHSAKENESIRSFCQSKQIEFHLLTTEI
ncbi:MAG: tRNA 2-thiocytidine(32) synthetase TtcA, partial [Candidatus Cloacimonetes bacterium]|nr:tRNA 2-thiocytidine(32) synthetase TtcA [Candidatus Cloacimonadota bacterium]